MYKNIPSQYIQNLWQAKSTVYIKIYSSRKKTAIQRLILVPIQYISATTFSNTWLNFFSSLNHSYKSHLCALLNIWIINQSSVTVFKNIAWKIKNGVHDAEFLVSYKLQFLKYSLSLKFTWWGSLRKIIGIKNSVFKIQRERSNT